MLTRGLISLFSQPITSGVICSCEARQIRSEDMAFALSIDRRIPSARCPLIFRPITKRVLMAGCSSVNYFFRRKLMELCLIS